MLPVSTDTQRFMTYVRVDKKANIKQIALDPGFAKTTGVARWVTQGSSLATQPDVSGDGRRLVFSSLGEKYEDLWMLPLSPPDIGNKISLTGDIHKDRMPRWAPDGERVAFYSDRSGNYEIWLANKNGSGLEQLTHSATETEYCYCPVWSPDGLRLAYYLNNVNTFIIETGKDWAEQTPQPLPEADASMSSFLPASWSYDGQKLAGWQKVGSNQSAGIVVYSVKDKSYEKLTDYGASPRWLSDNRRLLFSAEGKLQIVDSLTKKVATVMQILPDLFFGFALPRDERIIYFTQASSELDIWLSEIQ